MDIKSYYSTLEAFRRKASNVPVVNMQGEDGEKFLCVLHIGDCVQLTHKGERLICRVQKFDRNGRLVIAEKT